MTELEQYAHVITEVTAATGQPFLTATATARLLLWSGGTGSTNTIEAAWREDDGVLVRISYRIVPNEYLDTLAIVDRIVGAMVRHGIPYEVAASRG